jgi:flagellar protein FliS
MKSEEIITELMVSLDFENGEEISKNLFSLYTWFNRELMEANITQDVARMIAVKDMLCELRNSWSIISQNVVDQPNRETVVGLNIAG